METEQKYKKWELHNNKLVSHGQESITFQQWEIGYCGAIVEHIAEKQGKKDKVKKHIKNDTAIAELIRSFGGFYFSCYKNLLKLKIDRQYMFRFVYLCTLMDYNNKVIWGSAKSNNNLALEKDLQEILKLSERECRNTKNELKRHKLIIVNEDKTITVNDKYAVKGDIDKRKLRGSVRAMELGIQELYNKAKATEHKRLALLIDLLPYVNFTHNVLCHNPSEVKIEKIQAITLKELCKIVGYDETKSTRLKNELLKLTVNNEPVIGVFSKVGGIHVYVNPRIYYKGNNIEDLKSLVNMFRIK